MPGTTITQHRQLACAPSRAARELGLNRREFDLAVHLGHIRAVPDEGGGGGRRVERAEIARLSAQEGFPEAIRDSVRVVGTTEGAETMDVAAGRFTRLARLGLVVPVAFYPNRYQVVVWLYLAQEVRQFAADAKNVRLLAGRMPEPLRSQLGTGLDLRARNWRGRQLGFLLRQTDDPWERAGAVAAFLDPLHIGEVVKDPYERSHLNRFRQAPPVHGAPGSSSARIAEKVMTAGDPDEICLLRSDLARRVTEACAYRPAPRPVPRAARHTPQPPRADTFAARNGASPPHTEASAPRCDAPASRPLAGKRGLLGRLRRGLRHHVTEPATWHGSQ
ncbi:DUF6397 family protein [Streptomyces sp. NPDC086787]|uniref:DUF6397 family protein n=1 Tax=Streptomyces sp. NPDC086787 TaxID=3365759 RepID=UPI0038132763